MSDEIVNPNLLSQDERQLDLIRSLNHFVPCNPQGDAAEAGLKKILQSLNKNMLGKELLQSYRCEKLEEWKKYAEKE